MKFSTLRQLDTFGKRVEALRWFYEWRQSELAKRLGVDASFISLLEGDKRDPSLSTLKQLCDVFGCSMDWLAFGPKEQRP